VTPEESDIIDNLILSGALEPCGIDIESGEMLYNFTDKLKQVDPLLHDEFQRYFTSETMALWEHGFIEMDVTLDHPIVSLTQKAFDSSEVLKLDKNHQYTLKEIIRIILEGKNN
jgi:hypothetical protein